MTDEQKQYLAILVEFAREVEYNDSRFYPKDIQKAADILEAIIKQ